MFKGNIYYTMSETVVMNIAHDPSFIILFLDEKADIDEQLWMIAGPNKNTVPVLLPDQQALWAGADQGPEAMQVYYDEYLSQKEPTEMIITICKLLCNNNILLYVDHNDGQLYIKQLIFHISKYYGLNIGVMTDRGVEVPSSFNVTYMGKIIQMMYMSDLCTFDELIMLMPMQDHFNQFVLQKMALEVQPYIKNYPSLEQLDNYFFNYKNRCKMRGRPLIHIVRRDDY